MNSKFVEQLKKLKPVSREALKEAVARNRSFGHGAVAFEADVVRPASRQPAHSDPGEPDKQQR